MIESRPVSHYSTAQLETVLSGFRGSISQIPPMFSALKYKGRPLYQLARQGVTVVTNSYGPAQRVTIHRLRLLDTSDKE